MLNKQLYEDTIDESSKIRYEINEIHYKNGLSPLQKVAKFVLGVDPRDYKFIHDMDYYRGGYPNPESPPKLDALLNRFVKAVKWFRYLGWQDRIEKYLANHGIEIVINSGADYKKEEINYTLIEPKDLENAKKEFAKLGFQNNLLDFSNKEDLLHFLLKKSHDLQEIVCKLSDQIKFDNADKIEEQCEIRKPYFMKSVVVKYKEIKNLEKGKTNQSEIEKVKEDADNYQDAISIFL